MTNSLDQLKATGTVRHITSIRDSPAARWGMFASRNNFANHEQTGRRLRLR